MQTLKAPLRVLWVALGLGWASDLLFYGQSIGISVLLFVLVLLGSIYFLSRMEGIGLARRNLWLLEPLLFFSGMLFVRANSSLTFMNMTAVVLTLGLTLFFLAADRVERLGVLGYPVVLLHGLARSLANPVPPVVRVASTAGRHRERARALAPLLRGLLLALPVLIVFSLLLSSADIFFADYLRELLALRFAADAPEVMRHVAVVLTVAWLCAGAIYFSLGRRRDADDAGELYALPGDYKPFRRVGFGESATVLGLVCLLFGAFAWVQFAYLFSGHAERTMNYAAYREYVRQGFGELLLASLLTMALIQGLRWAARLLTDRHVRIYNLLSTALVALTLVMLVSAFWRMLVWENIEFYINTPLRNYVRVFIVFLGLIFLWLLGTMWVKPERFAIGAFVGMLVFLMTVNIMNPDAEVAAYNLAHREDDLATRFLYVLSNDAVPVLADGLRGAEGLARVEILVDLQSRLNRLETETGWRNWQAFHLSNWEAYTRLKDLQRAGVLCCDSYAVASLTSQSREYGMSAN
ncbi:MAG: DUF4173 domain-containing protein [Chloroflexota bacterium]|nr:DUF4173 domain-containing protein [Chloroflexota bacterium]